jgi:hypothetical protein
LPTCTETWIAAIEPPLILPLWRRWCNAVDR